MTVTFLPIISWVTPLTGEPEKQETAKGIDRDFPKLNWWVVGVVHGGGVAKATYQTKISGGGETYELE